MEPVTVICDAACTVSHVVSVDLPPFQLSSAEGALIASAVLAVWAVGFGFRAVIAALNSDSVSSIEKE